MPPVAATYYDGRSARAHPVTLTLAGDHLAVTGTDIHRHEPLAGLHVSEPMGAAPRLVKFADGGHCEVHDHAGFAALLAEGGHRDSRVVRWQQRWGWALLALLITVASVAAGYRWGLPAFSTWLAFKVPDTLVAQLGGSTLDLLDESVFTPSALPVSRQEALNARFAALASGPARPAYQVLYRDGGGLGANAFALPDGRIVVTDRLVGLAEDDEEILAVLAHELGHVEHRHGLRMLIQSSIVGLVVAWYVGDIGSLAAGLPTLVLEAGYSREHEREADRYAAVLLTRHGLSPSHLADMLAKLEADHGGGGASRATAYLASHPATQERIDALRAPVPNPNPP